MSNLSVIFGNKKTRMDDLPPEAWSYITGGAETKGVEDLYSRVSVLFRCVNARADAAASVPFVLENISSGKVTESSDSWNGGLGYLPKPRQIIRQLFMSTDFTNTGYAEILRNKYSVAKGLQYFVPTSITPKFDDNGSVSLFKRVANKHEYELQPDKVLHVWIQDAFVEIGGSRNSPVKAALQAAGVIGNLNEFLSLFFEHGAIDPIVGSVPRGTPADEVETAQGKLNQLLTGFKNAFRIRLVPTEDIKLQPLRSGLDSLKNNSLTQEQRENVSMALGVPLSFLLGNQATYATATQEEKTLIRWGVQPRLEQIYETMNEQIYNAEGYKFRPLFEGLEAFQEEEVNKTLAMSQFMDVVNKAKSLEQLIAMLDIFNYDAAKEKATELYAGVDKPVPPTNAAQDVNTPNGNMQDATSGDTTAAKNAIIELDRWERKVKAANGKPVKWHALFIPSRIAKSIESGEMTFAQARDEIRGNVSKSLNSDALIILAQSIDNAVAASVKENETH